MRGDVYYRVYGVHEGRAEDSFFGSLRTRAEAERRVGELRARPDGWAEKYHDQGFVIREFAAETDFEIPPLPKPRDRYVVDTETKPNRPGTWDSYIVRVYERGGAPEPLCEYERNYSLLGTFEPFRQGSRNLALVSTEYTESAVLDLDSGEIIAKEDDPDGTGFCPVGFFVPDWWDVNDGSINQGSKYWGDDKEWPAGDLGFVWGCHWGDDTSWKVQALDLSRVQEGILGRDERFGYLPLATIGFQSPVFTPDDGAEIPASKPPEFIELSRHKGVISVTLAVLKRFNLEGAEAIAAED